MLVLLACSSPPSVPLGTASGSTPMRFETAEDVVLAWLASRSGDAAYWESQPAWEDCPVETEYADTVALTTGCADGDGYTWTGSATYTATTDRSEAAYVGFGWGRGRAFVRLDASFVTTWPDGLDDSRGDSFVEVSGEMSRASRAPALALLGVAAHTFAVTDLHTWRGPDSSGESLTAAVAVDGAWSFSVEGRYPESVDPCVGIEVFDFDFIGENRARASLDDGDCDCVDLEIDGETVGQSCRSR